MATHLASSKRAPQEGAGRILLVDDDPNQLLLATDILRPDDLPANLRDGVVPSGAGVHGFQLPPEGVELARLESHLIRQALQRSQGNLRPAARLLGISYKTLQYRMRKHGLDRELGTPTGDLS